MEDAIAKRAGRRVEEEVELPDLRTIELPRARLPRATEVRPDVISHPTWVREFVSSG